MTKKKDKMCEVKWNLINSALAGALVFAGTAADGNITLRGIALSFFAGLVVGITKFKEFWAGQDPSTSCLFNFVNGA